MKTKTTELEKKEIDLDRLIDFLLDYASFQTSIGVQTSRIVRNSMRVAESFDCNITVMMFQRNVSISLIKYDNNEKKTRKHITGITHHKAAPINFRLNAETNALSYYAEKEHPDIETLEQKLKELKSLKPLNRWAMLVLISIANAAFCKIFGGDFIAFFFVFCATMLGYFARQEMQRRHAYAYATVLFSSFISSFTISILLKLPFISTSTPDIALSTSILYLVPGVPFINSVVDFFDGYMLNGWSRLLNALIIILSMTIGITLTLVFMDSNLLTL